MLRTGFFRVLFGAAIFSGNGFAAMPEMQVFKTKTCGCCAKWVDHMRAGGFKVTVTEVLSTNLYRQKYGVPEKLASCHTATVGGYSIEGHVPAADIRRLLRERPQSKGLAVPGMPMGSPGMEGAHVEGYSVIRFNANGSQAVFQRHPQ